MRKLSFLSRFLEIVNTVITKNTKFFFQNLWRQMKTDNFSTVPMKDPPGICVIFKLINFLNSQFLSFCACCYDVFCCCLEEKSKLS